MQWARLLLFSFFVLLQVGCAHKLAPCAACGAGMVCHRTTLPGTSSPAIQCFQPCESDAMCGTGQQCNCETPACTQHSTLVPSNVCMTEGKRRDDEFESRFVVGPQDREFCAACAEGQTCVDVGTDGKHDFRCIRMCTRDSECRAGTLCNCETADCTFHDAVAAPNVCVVPPPSRTSP